MTNKEKSKNKKKKRKKMKKFFKYFFVIIVPIIFSLIGIWYVYKENTRSEQILESKFSLEKNVDKDGSLIWKICNSGEKINNAIIYPTKYVTFWIYNDELDLDVEITIELLGYFSEENNNNYYYNYSEDTFYVKDEKQLQLNEFIQECLNLFDSRDGWSADYGEFMYFTLNYSDYKKETHNLIYTISDYAFREDNLEREIFADEFLQLEEISKIPEPDIIAPSKFEEVCVITINYKNASTRQLIENENDYEEYLYSAIVDLVNSKDKSVEEMLGEIILTDDGTAYIRDMEED